MFSPEHKTGLVRHDHRGVYELESLRQNLFDPLYKTCIPESNTTSFTEPWQQSRRGC